MPTTRAAITTAAPAEASGAIGGAGAGVDARMIAGADRAASVPGAATIPGHAATIAVQRANRTPNVPIVRKAQTGPEGPTTAGVPRGQEPFRRTPPPGLAR